MGRAVTITRREFDAADLRREASRTRDGRVSCRLLALAMVLEGASRAEAAAAGGMDRQTLRDWVHRYNAEGIAGLADQPREGRPPVLTAEQMQELKALVVAGPEPERDGVVRWRCIDLREQIAARYEVDIHERTVGKLLHRLDLVPLKPRPCHPKKDADAQEAFQKNFADLVTAALPSGAADKRIEIWFQDEARVGQQGTLTYVWAPRGSRPVAVRDNRHDSAYLFGAICPERAVGAAIIMPAVNSEAMAEHLIEISRQVAPGAHAVLVCDGAGWHQPSQRLPVPDNISLLRLPAYAPELNPMENVWEYLRANKLSLRVWNSYNAILAACLDAWNFLMATPHTIRSITHRAWASVKI
ncbi:IS630 family transposase [Rhodovastum atsumiense]|uniref:IS630 family transposase n=1 Tax=Rhodovastum atsumiense TaxID=504468 RepID=A0A5M6IK29_9PROT|nr:IS630 family transposase [Rhodovastum atsumiense]